MLSQIVLCGPQAVGKTRLARILGENRDVSSYEQTEGVRIQRIDRTVSCEKLIVELWDSGGDPQFQGTYQAVASSMDALVVCYDPEQPSHVSELEKWRTAFAGDRSVSVLLLALKKPESSNIAELTGSLKRFMNATVTFPSDSSNVQVTADAADAVLERLLTQVLRRETEAEEAKVMSE